MSNGYSSWFIVEGCCDTFLLLQTLLPHLKPAKHAQIWWFSCYGSTEALPLHSSRRFYLIPPPLCNTRFVALDIRKEQWNKAMIRISNLKSPQQLCWKQWRMTLAPSHHSKSQSKCCGCKWSENTSPQSTWLPNWTKVGGAANNGTNSDIFPAETDSNWKQQTSTAITAQNNWRL